MSFASGAKTGAKYGALAFAAIYGGLALITLNPIAIATGVLFGALGGAISGGLLGGIVGAVMEEQNKPKPTVLEAPPVIVRTPVVHQLLLMSPSRPPCLKAAGLSPQQLIKAAQRLQVAAASRNRLIVFQLS